MNGRSVRRLLGRGGRAESRPWVDTILAIDMPTVPASIHFRSYEASVSGRPLLCSAVLRFKTLLPEHVALAISAPRDEEARVRKALNGVGDVALITDRHRSQIENLGLLAAESGGTRILLLDLTAALLSGEYWKALWEEHVARGDAATILVQTPCARPPILSAMSFLRRISRAERSSQTAHSTLVSLAQVRRSKTFPRRVPTGSVSSCHYDDPASARWPYRVRLELPSDIEHVRGAVDHVDSGEAGHVDLGSVLDRWWDASKTVEEVAPKFASEASAVRTSPRLPTILFAQSPSAFTGVEVVVSRLAKALVDHCRNDYHVTALVGLSGTFTERLASAGCDVLVANRAFASGSVSNYGYARRLLETVKPALVHSHTAIGLPFCCALSELQIPLVQHVHVSHEADLRALSNELACAAQVLTVSVFVRDRVLRFGVPRSRVRVVYNGVPSRREPVEESVQRGAAVRSSLSLEPKDRVILMPARFARYKRHDVALAAFARRAKTDSSAHLLMVGDVDFRQDIVLRSLMERVRHENLEKRVHVLGWREDMEDLYAAADVVMLPSENEPFGLVVLEAMAAGVPVVASRSGGIPEIVENEVSGLLVRPGDAAGFSGALDRLLSNGDLRAKLTQRAKRRALETFCLEAMMSQTLDVYGEVLSP